MEASLVVLALLALTCGDVAGQQFSFWQMPAAIFVARGHRVMLDADLAQLYGVTTAALNQAVKRNADRFPSDFAFQVTQQEFTALMSQNVISKTGRGGRSSSSSDTFMTSIVCLAPEKAISRWSSCSMMWG